MEDFLGIIMFILFVGASMVGRMKKASGPRPPFDPRAKPVVESEDSDPYEDPWQKPAKPVPVPAVVTAQATASLLKAVERRPSRPHKAIDGPQSRFAELRSSFQVDDPIDLEGPPGEIVVGGAFAGPQDLAQAVIMSEVLGKPKALRNRRT